MASASTTLSPVAALDTAVGLRETLDRALGRYDRVLVRGVRRSVQIHASDDIIALPAWVLSDYDRKKKDAKRKYLFGMERFLVREMPGLGETLGSIARSLRDAPVSPDARMFNREHIKIFERLGLIRVVHWPVGNRSVAEFIGYGKPLATRLAKYRADVDGALVYSPVRR